LSRIGKRFAELKARGEGALVAFIVAGDPEPARSEEILEATADGGADIIELGAPFSDPLADGVVIQEASQRALRRRTSLLELLATVRRFRRRAETPLLVMTCYNLVLQFGLGRFAGEARAAGLDGALITDLPPEEADPWLAEARKQDLDTIFLLAPTSGKDRLAAIAERSRGFLYCVSRMGVTGERGSLPPELPAFLARARAATSLPLAVGFGLSTREQVRVVCQLAEGAVVGSAIVRVIAENAASQEVARRVRDFVAELKAGTTVPGGQR
jgi:tryptophan synthase alpha chain